MDSHSAEKTVISSNPRRRWPLVAVIFVVLIVGAIGLWLWLGGAQEKGEQTKSAADNFYSMLSNAAEQQKLRIAMYRATYATKADADANTNIGSQLSSIAELDAGTGDYRSVFAHNIFDKPKFDIGRCIGEATYNDNYKNDTERPDTLSEANTDLKTRVFQITQPLVFIPCPYLGIIPQGTPDLAVARLSDGVFPVTLSKEQATGWMAKVKAADLFEVKDEGLVDHKGSQLRKISFTPRNNNANQQLYNIFYETAEIDRIKREHPKASWQFGFISVNPNNTGGVGGFYLVNEERNLPVYSELFGTNPDKDPKSSNVADHNIARTKQTYIYPAELTITTETSLEFLE